MWWLFFFFCVYVANIKSVFSSCTNEAVKRGGGGSLKWSMTCCRQMSQMTMIKAGHASDNSRLVTLRQVLLITPFTNALIRLNTATSNKLYTRTDGWTLLPAKVDPIFNPHPLISPSSSPLILIEHVYFILSN